ENGQLEIGLPLAHPQSPSSSETRTVPELEPVDTDRESTTADGAVRPREVAEPSEEREDRARRGRRGRGRGRGREREERVRTPAASAPEVPAPVQLAEESTAPAAEGIGVTG